MYINRRKFDVWVYLRLVAYRWFLVSRWFTFSVWLLYKILPGFYGSFEYISAHFHNCFLVFMSFFSKRFLHEDAFSLIDPWNSKTQNFIAHLFQLIPTLKQFFRKMQCLKIFFIELVYCWEKIYFEFHLTCFTNLKCFINPILYAKWLISALSVTLTISQQSPYSFE